ncbi:MAG TPA: glycosyltransferase family 9 protein [Ktedonobacterales bacterium]
MTSMCTNISSRAPGTEVHPRIVLIRPGALGDALLTLPALAVLRRERPEVRVTLITRRDVLPLVKASALADDTHAYDLPAWSALFTDGPISVDPLAHLTFEGATVVAWMPDPTGAIATNLRALGAVQVQMASPRPLPDEREHMALRLAEALRPLGVTIPPTREALVELLPEIQIAESDSRDVRSLWEVLVPWDTVQSVVALHPGSGGAAKRWPPDAFAALAQEVSTMGMQPLLIEGPQDSTVCHEVLTAAKTMLPVARGLSVASLATILRRCVAYVGNDSGVSHLAGLLGVPALALFGPTDPALWAPLGPHVRVLRVPEHCLANLSPELVTSSLRELLHQSELARRNVEDAE